MSEHRREDESPTNGSADETFRVSVDELDDGQQQDHVTGSPRPARTNGFGLPSAAGDESMPRFVAERMRIMSRVNDETDEWAEQEEMLAQADQILMLKHAAHKGALLSRLNTFRRNRAFCDVVLFVDGHELLAHKAVLAAISPSLFDLFLSNCDTIPSDEHDEHTLLPAQALELAKAASQVAATTNATRSQQSQQQKQQRTSPPQNGATSSTSSSSVAGERTMAPMATAYFEFPETDFECMEALVEFAYTARLRVGSRRVKELYRTAFALRVSPVAQACAHWLAEHLTASSCIGIRQQANLNEDSFLLSRVDTFIRDNFDAVANESAEFAQLPCIKTRIIVSSVDSVREFEGGDHCAHHKAPLLPSGDELALRCLRYFKHGVKRTTGERVTAYIDSLTDKTHLLVANIEEPLQLQQQQQQYTNRNNSHNNATSTLYSNGVANGHNGRLLQDANELDEKVGIQPKFAPRTQRNHSSLGSCDLVKDYKRNTSMAASGKKTLTVDNIKPPEQQQPPLHVMGATPIKLNGAGMGQLLGIQKEGIQFESRESLCSLGSCSVGSGPSEGIGASGDSFVGANSAVSRQIICVLPTAPGFWVCLASLFNRLVRISIHLSEDEELLRSSRTSSVASSTDGFGAELDGAVISAMSGDESSAAIDIAVDDHRCRRSLLPALCEARCAIGAAFLDGKLLISGGYDRNVCLRSSEVLDIGEGDAMKWRPLAPMCSERARFDAAVVDGKIFAVAGSNGTNDLASCECFDPTTGVWTEVRPLERARSHNGCASIGGLLYCIGGSTDYTILGDCMCYDPKTNEWSEMAPMKEPRSQAGCTSWRGMVVCVGGCDRWNCLDSVEAYDPNTNQWHHLARLRTPRRGCAVAVLGHSLFAIGGHDGHNALTSVEVLDSPNSHWRPGPSMQQSALVHHHAVSAPDVGIFVIGGFDGTQFLASMEVLESEESGWHCWLENRKCLIDAKVDPGRHGGDTDDDPETSNTTPTPRG